ncbi:MAG TPA: HIT domain-containing protein [Candidatus Acidoferrales bacterium]|nr:HIT domain-containing protein [Candidatus Acidoferrales bacterium]
MDYLWTPWRYSYITSPEAKADCIFCKAARADDRASLIVHRARRNFVILNRYPYTNGHVMIVPFEHAATMGAVAEATLAEMMTLAQQTEGHLRDIYHPDGINVGMNLGKSAGAGISGHIHLHMLPRWTGDTNFMTVTGETRVLPEELSVTWERLRAAYAAADA